MGLHAGLQWRQSTSGRNQTKVRMNKVSVSHFSRQCREKGHGDTEQRWGTKVAEDEGCKEQGWQGMMVAEGGRSLNTMTRG